MDLAAIESRLEEHIKKQFEIDDADQEFARDVHLFDYGYIDSFGAVELMGFVHSEFNVEVTDADLITRPLNTISEIAGLIHERRVEKG